MLRLALVVCCACFGARATAQDSDATATAAARALFQEGVEHVEAERWDQAADRFERALAMRFSPVIAYNLASALENLGRHVEASEHLHRALQAENAPEPVRQEARALLDRITPRLAMLTVRIDGDTDVEVRLEDRVIPPAVIGVAAPADPGSHTLSALRDGETVASVEIELGEGAASEVTLSVPVRVPTPEEVAREAEPPPVRVPIDEGGPNVGAIVGGVVAAVVAVTVAIVLGVVLSGGDEPKPEPFCGNLGCGEWR